MEQTEKPPTQADTWQAVETQRLQLKDKPLFSDKFIEFMMILTYEELRQRLEQDNTKDAVKLLDGIVQLNAYRLELSRHDTVTQLREMAVMDPLAELTHLLEFPDVLGTLRY